MEEIDIFQAMKTPEENLFFSPLSIYTLLSMVFAGARGLTETQIKTVLHIKLDQIRFHSEFKKLLRVFQRDTGSELSMANLLCIHKNYQLFEKYLWIVEDTYGGAIWKLDFNAIPETCSKINAWVAEHTQGKIKDVIHTLKEDIGLVLVNAIYFKGTWENLFEEKDTEDENFTLLSGEEILVPMMHQKEKFRLLNEDGYQILEMPYKGIRVFGSLERISMIIFLPEKKDGIEEIEKSLTNEKIENYLEKLHNLWEREVKVIFPKFKIETEYELKKILYNLGMTSAFSDGAKFSGMAEDPPRYISQIIHKAFVEVNERGTEAAAVTALRMLGATLDQIKPPEFRADHPFIFLLIDSYTRAILFIGSVMNPKL
ncbi:MAG: serpin family protein [Promethearchaeota archaeon]